MTAANPKPTTKVSNLSPKVWEGPQGSSHYSNDLHEASESDRDLLAKICLGDAAAFRKIVERHTPMFYRVAYRFIQNKAEAEDILQDAFVKLWQRPNMWDPSYSSSFTTWFCRVIINLCLDRRKRKSPLAMTADAEMENMMAGGQSHDEVMAERQQQAFLEAQIAALPERQRTALNLCFYEGFSNQEAAEIMKLNIKAVQSLIMRAKTNLKLQFQKAGGMP